MRYLYIILDPNGHSWAVTDQGTERASLAELLSAGWQPLRETPFSGTQLPAQYVLILLGWEGPGSPA